MSIPIHGKHLCNYVEVTSVVLPSSLAIGLLLQLIVLMGELFELKLINLCLVFFLQNIHQCLFLTHLYSLILNVCILILQK